MMLVLLTACGYVASVSKQIFARKSRIKVSKHSEYLEKLRNLPVGTKMHIRHYYDLKS